MLEKLSGEFEGKAKLFDFDIDKSPGTPPKFGIMAIPTLIFFKDGKEADRVTGGTEDAIRQKLQSLV